MAAAAPGQPETVHSRSSGRLPGAPAHHNAGTSDFGPHPIGIKAQFAKLAHRNHAQTGRGFKTKTKTMKLEAVAAPPVGRHRRFANGSNSVGIAHVALIATHTK